MLLVDQTRDGLLEYLCAQIANFFPDGRIDALRLVFDRQLDQALARVEKCINSVRIWPEGKFDYLHSSQYCQFLYYLSNTIWRNEHDKGAATRLFLLNKALNGIDLFYEIELPEIFFLGHSPGIVFSKATYRNYLAVYQNSTIGRHGMNYPMLGEGVLMYPNTAIIGHCRIGDQTIVAQGVSVIDRDTPGNCYVFGIGRDLRFAEASWEILSGIFR